MSNVDFSRNYGHANRRLVAYAFDFLFPNETKNVELRKKFTAFVDKKFNKLGCAVIWSRNCDFPIGKKEVVITCSSVLTANDYKKQQPIRRFSL